MKKTAKNYSSGRGSSKDGVVEPRIKPNFMHGFLVNEHVTEANKILLSLYSEVALGSAWKVNTKSITEFQSWVRANRPFKNRAHA